MIYGYTSIHKKNREIWITSIFSEFLKIFYKVKPPSQKAINCFGRLNSMSLWLVLVFSKLKKKSLAKTMRFII